MSPLLRLLRIVGLTIAGLVGTVVLTFVVGGSGDYPPGLFIGIALWVVFPLGYHSNGRHALALDFWASLLLGFGVIRFVLTALPKQIGC